MIQLLFVELKRLWKIFFVLYAFVYLCLHYWAIGSLLNFIPFIAVFAVSSILRRSAWYLTLPWSRTKLISFVCAQNAVVFLLCCMLSLGILFIHGKLVAGNDLEQYWYVLIFGWLMAFAFGSMSLLYGITMRKNATANIVSMPPKWYIRLIYSTMFVLIIWWFELFKEPVVIFFCLSCALVMVCFALLKEFVVPNRSRIKGNIVSVILCTLVFISGVGLTLYAANFGNVDKYYSYTSLDVLGNFPSFISKSRALQLFRETRIGVNPSMEKYLNTLNSEISLSEWRARTAKCKYSDCLNLSSEVVDFGSTPSQDLEQNFIILLERCSPYLGDKGRVVCHKSSLESERLKKWLRFFQEAGVLSQWLQSDSTQKQLFAIKGTPYGASEADIQNVTKLTLSSDSLVRTTATAFVVNQKIWSSKKLDCDLKDKKDLVCVSKQKEFDM